MAPAENKDFTFLKTQRWHGESQTVAGFGQKGGEWNGHMNRQAGMYFGNRAVLARR